MVLGIGSLCALFSHYPKTADSLWMYWEVTRFYCVSYYRPCFLLKCLFKIAQCFAFGFGNIKLKCILSIKYVSVQRESKRKAIENSSAVQRCYVLLKRVFKKPDIVVPDTLL